MISRELTRLLSDLWADLHDVRVPWQLAVIGLSFAVAAWLNRLAGKIDRVLVDVPCSGLGTVRRNPDLKWRQSPQSVEELKLKQAAILRAAANLVKPGGRLVYATCSLLAEENEDIVAAFLADRGDFRKLHRGELLGQQGIALEMGEFLQLLPHVHGTDGFFAAALQRSA